MTMDEIKSLPIEQKIQIMEVLWEDLRDRFERSGIPEHQKKLLDERRERVRTGQAKVLNRGEGKENGRPGALRYSRLDRLRYLHRPQGIGGKA